MLSNNTLRFFTNSFNDVGVYKFQLTLSDTRLTSSKDFYVEFINAPPFFIKDPPMNLTLKFNNTFEYILPPYKDAEGSPIIIYITGFPPVTSFLTLVDPFKIVIDAN